MSKDKILTIKLWLVVIIFLALAINLVSCKSQDYFAIETRDHNGQRTYNDFTGYSQVEVKAQVRAVNQHGDTLIINLTDRKEAK